MLYNDEKKVSMDARKNRKGFFVMMNGAERM